MSIYKRGSSKFWWYAVRKPVSEGGGYKRGSTGSDNEDVARAIEQAVKSAMRRTAPADRLHSVIDALLNVKKTEGLLLAGIWTEYERQTKIAEKDLARITLDQRRQRLSNFADWAKKNRPACQTADSVDRACAAAYAEHLGNKGTKSKTRANILRDLATVWSELQRIRDDVTGNPWPLVVPAIRDSQRGNAFTPEQETELLKAAKAAGHGWWLACMIARHTGLRFGDIARITRDQIDLDNDLLRAKPSKTARHGIAVAIPLSAPLRDALASALASTPFATRLFPEMDGTYQSRHMVHPFHLVLEEAKLDGQGFTFHSWRHTFRTRLAEAGVSDEIAKRLGGWTVDKTAARYDHDGRLKEMRHAINLASGTAPDNEKMA